MNLDYDFIKKKFDVYVSKYDTFNDKINLKVQHTYRVVACSEYIAENIGLDKENIELAKVIGILHDIGRFEQLKRYNSYDDSIVSHAELGIDILFKQGVIKDYIKTRKYDEIIYNAIKQHGLYKTYSKDNQVMIIRDADKLDNFFVKKTEPIEAMLDISKQELEKQKISDHIYAQFMNEEPIENTKRKTKLDMWVSYAGYIFDINYNVSKDYILKNKYIESLIDRLNYTDEDTINKMNNIRKRALDFLSKK